jgi:hypothetical protein
MTPAQAAARRARWRAREEKFYEQHPTCGKCGGVEGGLRIHWAGEGPKPFTAMTEAFRTNSTRRVEILAQCIAICKNCWQLTLKRNEHGGGKKGIIGCGCTQCVAVRRRSAQEWERNMAARRQERRRRLKEIGAAVPPVRAQRRPGYKFVRTPEAALVIEGRRQQRKADWMAGRTCVHCGTEDALVTTWINPPGPMASTGTIWSYSDKRRAELLKKCHTMCVSCLRSTRSGKKKENK